MNKFKTAFTLAEVLITLVIVGIVAAMTIPTVISSTNDLQYAAGAKKINSNLINALRTIQANGGEVLSEGVGDQDKALLEKFCSVMSCAEVSHGEKNFFADNYSWYVSPNNPRHIDFADNQALLNNGVTIAFRTGYCAEGFCADIAVDLNGHKGPNTDAMDLYLFRMTKQQNNNYFSIYPSGMSDTTGQLSIDRAVNECLTYYACGGLRIYAPDKLPKTKS